LLAWVLAHLNHVAFLFVEKQGVGKNVEKMSE
jgi:hypothetical protein